MLSRLMNCLMSLMKLIWGFIKPLSRVGAEKIEACWKNRNKSLLYQSLKVGFVLLVLLFSLFVCKPQETSFFLSAETKEFALSNGKIEELDINTGYMAFSTFHSAFIDSFDVPYITIDGKKYTSNNEREFSTGSIFLYPTEEEGQVCIMANDDDSSIKCECSYAKDFDSIMCIRKGTIDSLPKPYWYYSKNKDSMSTEWDIDKLESFVISSAEGFTIYIYGFDVIIDGINEIDEITGEVKEQDVQLHYYAADYRTDYGRNAIEIHYPSGGEIVPAGFIKHEKEDMPNLHNIRVFSPKVHRAGISDIGLFETEKASGNVSVYYNPEPDNHNFMLQDLCIKSNDKTISVTISNADDRFSMILSGYANQLRLSKNSLLPDFFSMFKNNTVLPPALLVTMIGGAITLIKLHKDKDDKK